MVARAMRLGDRPVSYHRIAGEDGEFICVPDKDVAWHAGARLRPEWQGRDVNGESLGLCYTLAVDEAVITADVAAHCRRLGLGAGAVWLHREVSFSRTDARQIADADHFRGMVAALLTGE